MTTPDQAQELTDLRTAVGLSQSLMAHYLDLTVREYQAFEWGESEIPNVYILAAERVVQAHAAAQRDPMKMPSKLREEVISLARLAGALKIPA